LTGPRSRTTGAMPAATGSSSRPKIKTAARAAVGLFLLCPIIQFVVIYLWHEGTTDGMVESLAVAVAPGPPYFVLLGGAARVRLRRENPSESSAVAHPPAMARALSSASIAGTAAAAAHA
jgi:hypothetical protein